MKYLLTPVRMAVIEKLQIRNVGKDVEKKKPSYNIGGYVHWCTHSGNQYGDSLKY